MGERERWRVVARGDAAVLWGRSGTGPPVVLAHGLQDGWAGWLPLAAELGDRACYALDLPWRAGSTDTWCHRGTPADWLSRGLALVPEAPRVVIGHSFGANAVLHLLAERGLPASVEAVVLVAPFFRPPALEVDWALHTAALAGVRRIMTAGLRLRLGSRAADLDDDLLSAMAATVVDRIGPVGFGAFFQSFAASTTLWLSDVDIPVLVVAGRDDEALSGERATALATALPIARFRIRPHYSHFCHVEQADDVAADLGEFLDRVGFETNATPLTALHPIR
ncbi:alpha/beta hydrolase [Saccharothrix sp. S26]|uniref:alpha/beta fold hydrolase n=1 Tax=Saccharothrix sp. S26 TaxID=2907215 RepID=UPI001F1DC6DE|nr:alpha/beta hydrolase [Saccharothrix sp. S26]MCE6995129.1 alpha/beta hydrolase [Saccharothrix sp. S26]